MIMPLIAIFVVSAIISSILDTLTLGLSTLITGPATTAFIALYGMHVALDHKRKGGLLDLREMISYSVVFGVTLGLFKLIGIYAVQFLAIFIAQQNAGLDFSLANFKQADENVQLAFIFSAFSFFGLFSQFFFKIFAFFAFIFLGAFALKIIWFVETAGERISENGMDGLIELLSQIDPTATLIAVATIFVAIWLQAWIWSAAALAFLKHNDTTTKRATATRQVPAVPPTDLRALRKARDNRTK